MKINRKEYVDQAERVIQRLKKEKDNRGRIVPMVTTSQIRNLLAMLGEIYNDVLNQQDEILSGEIQERVEYLRMRCVYEAGRANEVKRFIEQAGLLDYLKEIGDSKEKFLLFHHYVEALVAFHRYYDGE